MPVFEKAHYFIPFIGYPIDGEICRSEQGKNLETIRKPQGRLDITAIARYLRMDDNEMTIAASEIIGDLMGDV